MESNKPKWDTLEPWANFIACDEDGRWYQYANEPNLPLESYSSKVFVKVNKWSYTGEFQNAGADADLEWAKLNWATSVEARPKADVKSIPEDCVVKPNWNDAPEWAMWLACDGAGKHATYWWWFESKPDKMSEASGVWVNTGGQAKSSGFCASNSWSLEYWGDSLEHRPDCETKPDEPEASSKKRVTLFIQFDTPVSNDAELAHLIAQAIALKLNESALTACGSAADSVKVAVGVTKYEEIHYDSDGCEFFIEGEEPNHDDDDDDDDKEF